MTARVAILHRLLNSWLGPALFVLCGWAFAQMVLNPSTVPNARAIETVLDQSGAEVELPYRKKDTEARFFRTTLVVESEYSEPQAVFIGLAAQPTQMRVNGVPLERITLRPGADEVGFRQSFLFLIPSDLLHAGGNSVEFSLKAPQRNAVLSDIWFGSRVELENHFRKLYAARVTLTQITAITAVLITLFAALIWLARPSETLYGWFALGVTMWLCYLMHFLWYRAPLNGAGWLAFIHIALGVSILCIQQFCRKFLLQATPLVDRIMAWITGLLSIIMLGVSVLAPDSAIYFVSLNIVFRIWLLVLGVHLVCGLARTAWQRREAQVYWLFAATVLGLSLGVFDSAVVLQVYSPSSTLLFHLGILPLVGVFGYMLFRRFVALLEAAEAQNAALDLRVQEKSQALEKAFSARQSLERERMLVEERHRLATDLHDGAGSQLVSLLAAVRREGIDRAAMEQALLEAIADLRLVMDSIDSMGSDLAEALGQFRSRIEPRLRAAGLNSIWRTANLRDDLKLSPRRTLNVFRALQEALVNVIKHSGATEVHISARDAGTVLELSVNDNGCGLSDALKDPKGRKQNGSRGLGNLDSRMRSLGGYAQLSCVEPGAERPGLSVRLYVPIPAENETKW